MKMKRTLAPAALLLSMPLFLLQYWWTTWIIVRRGPSASRSTRPQCGSMGPVTTREALRKAMARCMASGWRAVHSDLP